MSAHEIRRLSAYTRDALNGKPLAGFDSLRGLLKAEFAAGNLTPDFLRLWGLTDGRFGFWVSGISKGDAVAILLGSEPPESTAQPNGNGHSVQPITPQEGQVAAPLTSAVGGRKPDKSRAFMTELEFQEARSELIRGISIVQMIDDMAGKPYGLLVLDHLRKMGPQLRMAIAASVALISREEGAASEAIIDAFNAKGYDPLFWASDAGDVLACVSCDLNDALLIRAEEAGVFNLFQLVTQNFAQMAAEQPALKEFILDAIDKPPPPRPTDHGTITKMLGIAVADHEAQRLPRSHLLSILQAAIDNGDILLESNRFHAVNTVIPLIESGVLHSSRHSDAFEQQVTSGAGIHEPSREQKPLVAASGWKEAGAWLLVLPCAAAAAIVSYWVASIVATVGSGLSPEDGTVSAWTYYVMREWIGSAACGASFVYVGHYVAPRAKVGVAICFAAVVLFLSGSVFFYVIAVQHWLSLVGLVAMNFGAIAVAVDLAFKAMRNSSL